MSSAQARIDDARSDVLAAGLAARVALASAESARHTAHLAKEVSDTASLAARTAVTRCDELVRQATEQTAEKPSLGHVVAVATDANAWLAHRVPDLGTPTAILGVAHCGYLAEQMTLVRDMSWDDVDLANRCQHCEPEPGMQDGSTLG